MLVERLSPQSPFFFALVNPSIFACFETLMRIKVQCRIVYMGNWLTLFKVLNKQKQRVSQLTPRQLEAAARRNFTARPSKHNDMRAQSACTCELKAFRQNLICKFWCILFPYRFADFVFAFQLSTDTQHGVICNSLPNSRHPLCEAQAGYFWIRVKFKLTSIGLIT